MRVGTTLAVGVVAAFAGCDGSSSGEPPPRAVTEDPPPEESPLAGLDQRPSNRTCVAPAAASSNAGAAISLQRVFPNLSFDQPLAMLQAPGDDSRWFVVEKGSGSNLARATARVRVFDNAPTVTQASDFATLTVNAHAEGGLLGMAFHPDFATNGQVFLSWTENRPMISVIARFTVANGVLGDRQDILRVNKPFDSHNGGQIAFGPNDGYLYIALGDGGSGGDIFDTAQDTTDLLGSFLRIDVDSAIPYAIPQDNPFAGGPMCGPSHADSGDDCPEIFAWGVRNPWRWSFDTASGILWAGDVGQDVLEEVDQVRMGGNYGWDCREGTSLFGGRAPSCASVTDLVAPVHSYDRSQGSSVTGGYVYRGSSLPQLAGLYVFADFTSGRIWRLVEDRAGNYAAEELLDTPLSIASFGQGNDGELYVIDIAGGALHKIVDGGAAPPPSTRVPELLSETGCVDAENPSAPASGLIPYSVAAPFWSDGATKERWLAIPDGTSIRVAADGDYTFPNGTVLMKNFRLNGSLVETRLFMRHLDGEWAGYSYEWNAEGTDAALVRGGKTVDLGAQNWIFPSGNDCLECHTRAAGFALGVESAQLNHNHTYASTGRTANQLETLDRIALFETPLGAPGLQPRLPAPDDPGVPLVDAARAYLHTNCSGCHRPNGIARTEMDLRFGTALSATGVCDVPPQLGDLGLTNPRLIAPGSPERSVLLARMSRRDGQAMPPVASTTADARGATLLRDWIASMSGCH